MPTLVHSDPAPLACVDIEGPDLIGTAATGDEQYFRRKAHRAFFYEWLSPARFASIEKTGYTLDGDTRKGSIEREKESSFYVDYEPVTGRFLSPREQIDPYEAANRSSSLISLVITASYIKIALDHGDKKWNYTTFSEIPRCIQTRFTYQQDMPAILDRFAARSDRHRLLVENVRSSLRDGVEWLRTLRPKSTAKITERPSVDRIGD
jgi:hypothetical protein